MHGFVQPVLAGMSALASLVCAFLLVTGGISYITSSGDPGKLQHAKRQMARAAIGLAVVVGAAALGMMLIHAYGPVEPAVQKQLPLLSGIKSTKVSGGLVEVLIKAISGVLSVIIKTAAHPFISALNYFTSSTPLLTHNSSVVHLWLISVGIADSLLALVIALIGFHIMGAEQLGLRDVSLKSLLPQIIIVFIIMNCSIYLLDGVIELSNAMISAVRAGIGSATPWNSLLAIISGLSGYSLAALVIFVILIVFSVILLIYYIGRIVTIYLGAVLSPIVILLWLIPGFRDFAENALKAYLATIYVLFIHVIILGLAGSLFAQVSSSKNSDPLMLLLLGLATLIALIKTQGVLMQLNYTSLGPKTARRIGGSFINGVSYIALSARYNFAGAGAQIGELGNAGRSYIANRGRQFIPPKADSSEDKENK